MTLAIKHNFVTTKADGTDETLLRPSNWNEDHAITLASATLVGRQSSGSGAAEEIPCTALAASILAAADFAALAALGISVPMTGDGKVTLRSTADPGWVLMDDGTIGDATSGASNRASSDCEDLFTLIYNNVLDANAPVLTSAGAATTRAAQGTAASAWAAHCRLSLPKQLGRAIVGAGTGSGLTARPLGSAFGSDTHTLIAPEIPNITSSGVNTIAVTGQSDRSDIAFGQSSSTTGGGGIGFNVPSSFSIINVTSSGANAISVTSNNTGSQAHSITQASAGWNVMVKL